MRQIACRYQVKMTFPKPFCQNNDINREKKPVQIQTKTIMNIQSLVVRNVLPFSLKVMVKKMFLLEIENMLTAHNATFCKSEEKSPFLLYKNQFLLCGTK